jgi:hypothetical protein
MVDHGFLRAGLLGAAMAVCASFLGGGIAKADTIVTYNLNNVTLSVGGTVTGSFTYDTTVGGVLSWSLVSTETGNGGATDFTFTISSSNPGDTATDRADWNSYFQQSQFTATGGGPGYNGGAIDFVTPGNGGSTRHSIILAFGTNLLTDPASEPLYARGQSLSPGGDCSYEGSNSNQTQTCFQTGSLNSTAETDVPEPASMLLLGAPALGILGLHRRRAARQIALG